MGVRMTLGASAARGIGSGAIIDAPAGGRLLLVGIFRLWVYLGTQYLFPPLGRAAGAAGKKGTGEEIL